MKIKKSKKCPREIKKSALAHLLLFIVMTILSLSLKVYPSTQLDSSEQKILPETIRLNLGDKTKIQGNPKNIWIQDKKILEATALPAGVFLIPKSVGNTVISLDGKSQKVQVIHPEQKKLKTAFEQAVDKIPGLSVSLASTETLVEGIFLRNSDYQRLKNISLNIQQEFKIAAHLSLYLQKEIQNELDAFLARNGLRSQKIIFGEPWQLRISIQHPDYRKIEKLIKFWGIELLSDETQIINAPTIHVHVTVAEVQKSLMKSLGVEWPGQVSLNADFQVIKDELQVNLKALENSSLAQILASPNLICQSGQEAEFLAGGEFPIKFITYKQKEVTWKKYGVLLKVNPRADSSGRISLKLEAEISEISDIIEGLPSIKANRVSSTFNLADAQTIVLSGLLQNQSNKSFSGIPSLKDIPILGRLFSSENYLNKQTELVIFVRPEVQNDIGNKKSNLRHLTKSIFIE